MTTYLKKSFDAYCSMDHGDMDSKGFATLCRDSRLFDWKFTVKDAELIFARMTHCCRQRMDFEQFQEALRIVKNRKGISLDNVLAVVSLLGKGATVSSSKDECQVGNASIRPASPIGSPSRLSYAASPLTPRQQHLPTATWSRVEEASHNTVCSSATQQKEGWVSKAFKVFSGNNQTMNFDGFSLFCKRSKFDAMDARLVFVEAASDEAMDLLQFKNALRLLVEKRDAGMKINSEASNPVKRSISLATRSSCDDGMLDEGKKSDSSDTSTTDEIDAASSVASSLPSSPAISEARAIPAGLPMDSTGGPVDDSLRCKPHLRWYYNWKAQEKVSTDLARRQVDCLPQSRLKWTPPTIDQRN